MTITKHILAMLLLGAMTIARAADDQHAQHQEVVASAPMSEGEVRKIDPENRKLTLRHGPLVNLNMPGMTMVFTARDGAMLEGLEEGSRIRFIAERIGGVYTIVRLERE